MQFHYEKRYQSLVGALERISHDVNNYCTAILYHVETLKESASPQPYGALKSLNLIVDKVVRLSESLTQLASSEEVEANQDKKPINLRALLEDMLAENSLARAIRSEVDWRAPVETLVLDAHAIERVFYNLFVNSIEAKNPSKDAVTIKVEAHQKHHQLVLIVADDGLGLGDRSPSELFQPHYSTKGQKGRGLGLAIAREIVEAHGGAIAAKASDEGMRFIINFPLPTTSTPSGKTLDDHKQTKVLLVTKDDRVATFFDRAQKELPFQMLTASTALPMNIKYQEFDVLFYDTASPISLHEVRALLRHKVATYMLEGHSKGQVQVRSEASDRVIGLLNYHFFRSFFEDAHSEAERETLLMHVGSDPNSSPTKAP